MVKNQELNLVLSDMNGTDTLRRYIMEYADLSPDEQIEIERILDDAVLKLTGDLIRVEVSESIDEKKPSAINTGFFNHFNFLKGEIL